MKFARNTTAKDFLKIQSVEALDSIQALTGEERYAQAKFAQSVRNFWFTATGAPFSGGAPSGPPFVGQTPRLSEPVVVADILSMVDYIDQTTGGAPGTEPPGRVLVQAQEYGGRHGAYGEDLFSLSSPTFQEFLFKHEKNRSTQGGALATLEDIQGKLLNFVPRLLEPYQNIQARWSFNPLLDQQLAVTPQLGLRAVRSLAIDNPYTYLKVRADEAIKRYINGSNPTTFFLELEIPFAKFPVLGIGEAVFKTEQSDRPLLVLGACSNIEGAQARLYDESQYYDFTLIDQPINWPPKTPFYRYVPLNLWAPNTDWRTANLYNMFPVPHFLEPGAQLTVTIVNGYLVQFNAGGGFFLQPIATRNSQEGRISFLCRTV